MIPPVITNDLRNGLSLEETLIKHNTNLKELFKNFAPYPKRTKQCKPYSHEWLYIQLTKYNSFRVYKTQNRNNAGCYSSFEDARIVRDEMVKCDWDLSKLPGILKKHNIQRNKRGGDRSKKI